MAEKDRLATYHAKRDLTRTPEPGDTSGKDTAGSGALARFVVQRHAASTLHFDFRLEIDGVLVSWSVPKGPSLNPVDKRLAIRTENHPLSYLDFEGVIPRKEYGGGSVIVWDIGTFVIHTKKPANQALAEGHLKVHLRGQRLQGTFVLIKTKYSGRQEQWLLIKEDDEDADRRRKPAKTQLRSVLTGLTNKELEKKSSGG